MDSYKKGRVIRLSIYRHRPRQIRRTAMGLGIEVIAPPSYSLCYSNARSRQIQDVQRDVSSRSGTARLPFPGQRSDRHGSPVHPYGYCTMLCQISRVHRPVKDHIVQPCSHDSDRNADDNKIQDPDLHPAHASVHASCKLMVARAIPAVISIPYHMISI